MSANSKIEWTTHTFNPWWGCVKVSPACDHCYAESFSKRVGFSENGSQFPIWGKDSRRRFFADKHWQEPIKWNADAEKTGERPRVFCGSMCDVMEDREDLQHSRVRLYNLIDDTPHLDWLLLTKRPQNFRRFLPQRWIERPRPNVWGMTTVESDEYYWRLRELIKTPFTVRGISVEPLLGSIDIRDALGSMTSAEIPHDMARGWLGLHWVIVGGESGTGARPIQTAWVTAIRDQCQAAGVAFHFKQWGDWLPAIPGVGEATRVGKKAAGRVLDGRTWDELPEVRG